VGLLFAAIPADAVKYKKVKSFKDIGQNRAFLIALTEEVPSDKLEEALWEIVNEQMDKYGQAPQMWIYFFDNKKFTPKKFPIEGEAIDHLIATYFYATDTRKKDLKILTPEHMAAYLKLSDSSFQKLKDEEIPDEVLESLKSLEDKEFTEEELLDAVKDVIGDEQTDTYKELILKHADTAEIKKPDKIESPMWQGQ
jgi:hypothetical protein